MTTLDFLLSEYQWCLDQYARLMYDSQSSKHYMMRAMQLEIKINEYKMNSTQEYSHAV